ncbi:MAG: glycosyltransferase family 2 protein [Thermoflexibacteraceae bacterium]
MSLRQYPKISIITPSYNQADYLRHTITSILNQNYPNLEYIIIDGGSTDGSLEIIKEYASQLSYWESEGDKGMYHALHKGFERSTGEIMAWLNADDILQPNALWLLAEIFSQSEQIEWIQGYPSIIDENNRTVRLIYTQLNKSFFYSKKYIATGTYIQQESTFWRRSLWEKAGGYISQDYHYAGDFELWIRFFQYAPLHFVYAPLGAFRMRNAQQASQIYYQDYVAETVTILAKYPLSPQEQRLLRNSLFYEKIANKCNFWVQKLFGKHIWADNSFVENKIYFNREAQEFRYRN